MYPQLPPVNGAHRVCCGHGSGIPFPRLLRFGGCATHVTPGSEPGYSYSTTCSEKSEHIYFRVYPQLPPVNGAHRVCCGHGSGIPFPRLLRFGGCATHVTPGSEPGYSYSTTCSEKSEHNCLTSYWYNAAILASFLFTRVFKDVVNTVGGLLVSRRVFCWLPLFFLFLFDKFRLKHLLKHANKKKS